MSDALHYLTIEEVGKLIRARTLTCVALTEHMLTRIEQIDGYLKSYATVTAELALDAARKADDELAQGTDRGPLHGIPIAVKDLCYTRGVRTMGGLAVRADFVPQFDATVVTRLHHAGAVPLGKLNLTEGAMAGYNPAFAVPENPWRESYWSGASSSGSGAACAAGLAFATLGSDTGGSIRHPAAACGVVGLKPTYGRVSRFGVLDLAASLDHVGPLARTARDAGLVLQAIAGADPQDPTSLLAPVPDMAEPGDPNLSDLTIGFDERYATEDLEPDYAVAINHSLTVMQSLGARIVPVLMPPNLRHYLHAWAVLCSSEAAAAHRETYPARADEYGPWFRQWLELGHSFTAIDYAHAQADRTACSGGLNRTLHDVDLLLCPSTARSAYPVNAAISYGPIPEDRDPWTSRFTVPTDYAGLPTIALPCGLNRSGLPLSVQFVGPALSEALLVRAGDAFQRVTDFHRAHPPPIHGYD